MGSWSMCENEDCNCLQPRLLTQGTLTREQKPYHTKRQCVQCQAAHKQPVLAPKDVPEQLRNLSERQQLALGLFEIDTGPYVRASSRAGDTGYRQHTSMIRFSYHQTSVYDRIMELPVAETAAAMAAYEFLYASPDTNYKAWDDEFNEFLAKYPHATDLMRKRRLEFIEEVGIECAVWPALFWNIQHTFSNERATNPLRSSRWYAEANEAGEYDPYAPAGGGDDDAEQDAPHSIKRMFAAKVLSPLLGYASVFEVVQFAYDLQLWTALGSKKNLGFQIPMRIMMRGHPFSPMYWKSVHYGLLDMVRQLGEPKLFWTIAPYEWSFPYHEWVRDELHKELRARLHLPVAETLHILHVLLETVRALLLGGTGRARVKEPILKMDGADGKTRKIHSFVRVEFQDGRHKLPTQDYHGSCRVHLHVLLWLDEEDWQSINLHEHVSASLPDDPTLRKIVEGSQFDQEQTSKLPRHEGASMWDNDARRYRIHHPREAKEQGVRAFFVELMEVLRCHQDLQFAGHDVGLLRAYVAKYVSKFSDSASDEWLNDDAVASTIAATVLFRYKPIEPEEILQLLGARFRQWRVSTVSGGKRDFLVPLPDDEWMPEIVKAYESSAWARGQIPLLDFLRKTNEAGEIVQWVRKAHAAAGGAEPLEAFARNYQVHGEKIVAAHMLSRLNDKFHGQWLMLHVPFNTASEFFDEDILRRVPPEYRYLTMALNCEHPIAQCMWQVNASIEREMYMEAHHRHHVETVINMVKSHRSLVERYLNGDLDAEAELAGRVEEHVESLQGVDEIIYNVQQQRFVDRVDAAITQAHGVHSAEHDRDVDAVRHAFAERGYGVKIACVCFGPPGTGKTTITKLRIKRVIEGGGRVLFALPTAQLASRMREVYGTSIDIDTCAAAFGFMEEDAAPLPVIYNYDLVVIDEISQLEAWQTDKILRIWVLADMLPALVFLGDKGQMSGFGDLRPWQSPIWKKYVWNTTLVEQYRCKDEGLARILSVLRMSLPDDALLRHLQAKTAWKPPGPPTVQKLRTLLHAHPQTTILTCTRFGAHEVNVCAMTALFGRFPPKATIDADIASNPENYVRGVMKPIDELQPTRLDIFVGMKIYLTHNVNKSADFVNGMLCDVVRYDARSRGVEVFTRTGRRLMVFPWTNNELGNHTYYPMRAGYASTIIKFAGAELPHVTVYLEIDGIPGAAYTAISRVEYEANFLLAGILTAEKFTPVN